MTRRAILIFSSTTLLVLTIGIFAVWLVHRVAEQEQPVTLKIGFSSDWEYGSRKRLQHKLTNQAPAELEKVVRYYNEVFHPDIVVAGGDYIEGSGVKLDTAKRQLQEVNDIFQRLEAPRVYALGNHDMRALSRDEVMEILGISASHSITDRGDWRIVVFDTNFNRRDDSYRSHQQYAEGYVSVRELRWLEAAITTDRPTLVFSHHSPIMTYNVDNVLARNISNEAEVQAVLNRHKNVVAVVSGHTPRVQHAVVNGIDYFISDTLVNEEGLGAFAAITAEYLPTSRRVALRFDHFGLRTQSFSIEKMLDGAK